MFDQFVDFVSNNFIISVAVAVFIIVQVVKQFMPDKKYMYVLALVLGIFGALAFNEFRVTFDIVVAGLASGAIAIVFYDYGFEDLLKKNKEE